MAKNLPVVGEAFLGSDPGVSKVIKIAVGVDTTDGVNDVILVGTALANLLTVSDTKFMITDIKFRIIENFSATNDFRIGVNSSVSLYCDVATVTARPSFGSSAASLVGWQDMATVDTSADSGMISGAGGVPNPLDRGLTFPATASAVLTAFAIVAPTIGNVELYVFYVETP